MIVGQTMFTPLIKKYHRLKSFTSRNQYIIIVWHDMTGRIGCRVLLLWKSMYLYLVVVLQKSAGPFLFIWKPAGPFWFLLGGLGMKALLRSSLLASHSKKKKGLSLAKPPAHHWRPTVFFQIISIRHPPSPVRCPKSIVPANEKRHGLVCWTRLSTLYHLQNISS